MTVVLQTRTEPDVATPRNRVLARLAGRVRGIRIRRWIRRACQCREEEDWIGAFRHFLAAARYGDADAQFELYRHYSCGWGVISSPSDAVYWCRRAARQGHTDARFELSLIYLHGRSSHYETWYRSARGYDEGGADANRATLFPHGLSVPPDHAEALAWAMTEADAGRIEAKANVGLHYLHGLGCPQDFEKARIWLDQAAAGGNPQAQNALGIIYEHGLGVERDRQESLRFYAAAAGQGDANALFALGRADLNGELEGGPDLKRAFGSSGRAADSGHSEANFHMGVLYLNGTEVPRDFPAAESYLRRAADKSHIGAAMRLAAAYAEGAGLEKNLDNSALWYRKAAETGESEACFRLGCLLADGAVPSRVPDEAQRWLLAAIESGLAPARSRLAALWLDKAKITGVEPETVTRALDWYLEDANRGEVSAQLALFRIDLEGFFGPRDLDSALYWLGCAVDQGDPEAITTFATLLLEGVHVTADPERATRMLTELADMGYGPAARRLAMFLESDGKRGEDALRWYRVAAEWGDSEAQFVLGAAAQDQAGVCLDDPRPHQAEAAFWFGKAAERGNAEAQFHLASLMMPGAGTARDEAKARSLFLKAAGLGHGPAHHRLGAIFLTGTGVDADATEAARWFRKAAELGVAASQIAMGDLLQSGLAGEGTPEDARAWFEMAARRDHPEAGARLAALDAAFREGVQPKV